MTKLQKILNPIRTANKTLTLAVGDVIPYIYHCDTNSGDRVTVACKAEIFRIREVKKSVYGHEGLENEIQYCLNPNKLNHWVGERDLVSTAKVDVNVDSLVHNINFTEIAENFLERERV